MSCNKILIKTRLGYEQIVASRIKDLDPSSKVIPAPKGFKGLVLVESENKDRLAEEILKNVVEAEKVFVPQVCVKADINDIIEAAKLIIDKIGGEETFAVRTYRRGKHSFTSIDVNIALGDIVRKNTGAQVNLTRPDKILQVEIIGDEALLAIVPGSIEYKKKKPGKHDLYKLFWRLSIVQTPYLGPIDAVKTMGLRIGREVQNFEVKEYIVAPTGLVDAFELAVFINSLIEGINSRYEVQKKSYGRNVQKVSVKLEDLYSLVRDRRNEVIIVFEPEGEPVSKLRSELEELILKTRKRVNLLFGSREGVPLGVYRFADLVVDIAPGITLSTEYAVASALIAIGTILHESLGETFEGNNISSR